MIHSVFKYMPARVEFFENFLLRGSHKTALNDPFEVRPSLGFLADACISMHCYNFGRTRNEIIKYFSGKNKDFSWLEIEQVLPLYEYHGIISFTEEHDNLLMWSHYSDQHRGIVIEFDCSHPFFTKPKSGYRMQPVIYRKTRLDKFVGNSLMEPYFHKSKEWAYEQEHRLLVCLDDANVNLIPRDYFPICNCIEEHKYIKRSDCEAFDSRGNLFKIKSGVDYSIVTSEPQFMAMFKVPYEAIKSVCFGALIVQGTKNNILEKLECNKLKHVKKYQAKIDLNDYSLQWIEI